MVFHDLSSFFIDGSFQVLPGNSRGLFQATEEDLPRETEFLKRYDQFRARIEAMVDMPDRTIDLLFRFLHQNDGRLSVRAREKEFGQLTEAEVSAVEAAYLESFPAGS